MWHVAPILIIWSLRFWVALLRMLGGTSISSLRKCGPLWSMGLLDRPAYFKEGSLVVSQSCPVAPKHMRHMGFCLNAITIIALIWLGLCDLITC